MNILTTIQHYSPHLARTGTTIALLSLLTACDSGSTLISSSSPDVFSHSHGTVATNNSVSNDQAGVAGPNIKDRAIKILPLGDSITKGSGSCSYRTPLINKLKYHAAEFVGKQGKDAFHSSNCSHTNFQHEGRSRWRTIDWLEPMANGTNRAYGAANLNSVDIVLLHIGSNDIYKGELPGNYNPTTGSGTGTVGRIGKMIDDFIAGSPTVHVYVADLIPWLADPVTNTNLNLLRIEINAMVEHRAAKGENVTLVKLYEGFQPSMLQADQIHPNAAGDEYMANQWLGAMRSDGFFLETANTSKVRVEAESGILTGNMKEGYDGSGYVTTYYTNDYQADYVTLNFSVQDTGVYRALGRVKGTSTKSDSLFFQILPEGEIVKWSIPATDNYETDYVGGATNHYIYLSAGSHSARVYNRRVDARVDWLEFQFLGANPNGDVDGDGVANAMDLHPNNTDKN